MVLKNGIRFSDFFKHGFQKRDSDYESGFQKRDSFLNRVSKNGIREIAYK